MAATLIFGGDPPNRYTDGMAALLEREDELRLLSRVLEVAASGEGSVSVIAAAAGMGKTTLLEAAAAQAGRLGMRVLVARASELERDFAFGVVRQLLEPAVLPLGEAERAVLLAGAARHAAAVLDLDPEAGRDRDLHATLHGLYWLVVNLAAAAPLLIAVDDLQWCDEPSLRWLAHAARRLEGISVTVVGTLRTGPAEERPALVDELLAQPRTLRVEPGALSADAVATLLERELGQPGEPAFAAACHAHTGGNPFLASELVAELAAERIAPTAGQAEQLERVVPERVGETIRRHLARVSGDARRLAAAVAVAGDGVELAIAAELADMLPERAATAALELTEAAIFADAAPPRFRHPLLRAAVEAGVPAGERARGHARAARLLAERGAAPARVATHLAAAPPGAGDPWVVDQLRAAALSARSQGVPERAAELLDRALAEPPPDELRGRVLHELGEAELLSNAPATAVHLAAARELSDDLATRAGIAIGLGLGLYFDGRHEDAVDTLEAAIDEAAGHPELREDRLRLEAILALAGRYDLSTEARVRGRIGRLAEGLTGDTPAERLVRSVAAAQSPGPTAADLLRATELEERASGTIPWPNPTDGAGVAAMYLHAGRPDRALALTDRMLVGARAWGSHLRHAMALTSRAVIALDVGDLRGAEADFEVTLATMSEFDASRILGTAAGFYALTLARRGLSDRAEDVLTAHRLAGDLREEMMFNPTLFCRGDLRLIEGRFDAAEADFRELGRRHAAWGMTRPTPPWRSACALALVGQDRHAEARALAREELELARRWDTPKAIAYATRALALTHDGDGQIEGLAEAVALLDDRPWRYERAVARFDLGSALRRAGRRRQAREALALAMDEAHACGAGALADRAADELRASGARPRRRAISGIDALTPSERRVADLAASGRTNREIAEQLFITMVTVETHLTRVYRKLDLDGRTSLADALSS